jgi:hypothetical protein
VAEAKRMGESHLSPRSLSSLLDSWTARWLVLIPWLAALGTVIGLVLGGPSCIEGFGGNIGLEDTAGGGCVLYLWFSLLVSIPILGTVVAVVALAVVVARFLRGRSVRVQ